MPRADAGASGTIINNLSASTNIVDILKFTSYAIICMRESTLYSPTSIQQCLDQLRVPVLSDLGYFAKLVQRFYNVTHHARTARKINECRAMLSEAQKIIQHLESHLHYIKIGQDS